MSLLNKVDTENSGKLIPLELKLRGTLMAHLGTKNSNK